MTKKDSWLKKQQGDSGQTHPDPAEKRRKKPGVTLEDVDRWLRAQKTEVLADMLMEQVRQDERLRERLLLKVARGRPGGLDLGAYYHAIDSAVETGGFVDYRSAYDYAQGIEEVIGSMAELLKEGHADEVIELAEYAVEQVEGAMGHVDDSDGWMGGILNSLTDLHLRACRKAKPDPEALARRIFAMELRFEYAFDGAFATYKGVLGKQGMAVYRALAREAWEKLPQLDPNDERNDDCGRFTLKRIMETLAEDAGDLEGLVAIKSRELTSPYGYLEIAGIYKRDRKNDQALEWAERGLAAFPTGTDWRLREFLAEEYHRRRRHEDAMALVWAEFCDRPQLGSFEKLKAHAGRTGQWAAWREKALAFIRHEIEKSHRPKPKGNQGWWPRPADRSELVRIYLWEGDAEAAWREAKFGGCTNDLWLKLAATREQEHPEDALAIYQKQIDPILNQKHNEAYRDAVKLLRKIKQLMERAGRSGEFDPYLAAVRASHKPKRNFMKLLDHARL